MHFYKRRKEKKRVSRFGRESHLHFCVADKKIKQRTVLTTGPGFVFLVDCSGAFSKRKLKLVIQWAFVTPT